MPPTSRKPPSIRLRCRDFTFVAFQFTDEALARDVYDTIKALTCGVGRPDKLYAYIYEPPPAEKKVNGWEVYDARKEFRRMGVGPKAPDRGWRLSDINHDYVVCYLDCAWAQHQSLTIAAVFPYLPRTPRGAFFSIRQRSQTWRQLSISSPHPCTNLPSPRQQLFHHQKFTTVGRYASRQAKPSGRAPRCSYIRHI